MKIANKETQIKIIKSMLKRRLIDRKIEGITDKCLTETAEEIYNRDPNGITALESVEIFIFHDDKSYPEDRM